MSRQKTSTLFTLLFLFSLALALPAPVEARDPSGVTWPKDGLFHNPLVVMTTAAASGDAMKDYTDVTLYVLMPPSATQGVSLADPNTLSNTINPSAITLSAKMHTRGQATSGNPKHQFDVKLKPPLPAKNFMNMPNGGTHWVFNATGGEVQDATMIRNVMAFDMQRTLGVNTGSNAWAPRTKYFEFFAIYNYTGSGLPTLAQAKDGYMGVYINFEHIRADNPNRVPIPADYAPVTDNAVGGVIMQVNPPYLPGTWPIPPTTRQQLLDSNVAGNSSPVLLEWPELDFFNGGGGTQAQLTNIQNWFYNPDQGGDFLGWAYLFTNNCTTGPPSGANNGNGFLPQPSTCPGCTDTASYWALVEKYTDLQSFAEYFLLNELAKDPDGYHKSTFMYRQPDVLDKVNNVLVPGLMCGGPLWDKNKSYYGYGDPFNSPDGWLFTVANCGQAPYWWEVFSQYSGFQTLVTTAWQNSYNTADNSGAFDYQRISDFVQAQVTTLMGPTPAKGDPPNGPFTRDQQVWYSTDPTAAQTQLTDNVNTMLSFIQNRLIWMNSNLPILTSAVATDCHQ